MKKHLYAIVSFLVFCIMTYIGYLFRSEIFGNQTYLALFASFYGAIVGGMIGGLGSFYGGLVGASLSIKKSENLSRISLFKQINYTHDLFLEYKKNNENKFDKIIDLAKSESLIYDRDWAKHLNSCSDIESNYFSLIVDWFNVIRGLEIKVIVSRSIPEILPEDIDEICLKISSMENVLKKYNNQKF